MKILKNIAVMNIYRKHPSKIWYICRKVPCITCCFLIFNLSHLHIARRYSLDDILCFISLLTPGEYTQASTKWRHWSLDRATLWFPVSHVSQHDLQTNR